MILVLSVRTLYSILTLLQSQRKLCQRSKCGVDFSFYFLPSYFTLYQNVESKGMRDQRLDLQRRAAETSDDDLIPFGDRPTVSRFGAISRTSKTIYQGAGPMQAMAPQGAPTKSINISGKNLRGKLIWSVHSHNSQHHLLPIYRQCFS